MTERRYNDEETTAILQQAARWGSPRKPSRGRPERWTWTWAGARRRGRQMETIAHTLVPLTAPPPDGGEPGPV